MFKGLAISINHNVVINQITAPLDAGLYNGKHFMVMHYIVTLS